jgi:hypothetical protein
MKYQFRILIILAISAAIFISISNLVMAQGHDRTESDACNDCHLYPGDVVMTFYISTWEASEHGDSFGTDQGNTYCAQCHSPLQADLAATSGTNDPISISDWQDVTCSVCHPPHNLRVEWGTPTGLYDISTGGWTPVYREESNDLCTTNCHAGDKHLVDFKAVGSLMVEKKAVLCIDCHIPKVPNTEDTNDRLTRTHSLKVSDNVPWSCGIYPEGCHESKTEKWAQKQINKMKIHGKNKK